ncbi:NF-kappa-B inhibitor zeta [Rhinophrynus dorsalis]
MIVERVIDDSLELLDHDFMMSSPMNLGFFYGGSPVSDPGSSPSHSSSSPAHSFSSGPGSPGSDSDSLSASWPATKKAGNIIGRQQKGTFQGVRVKNSVRELLMQLRSKADHAADDYQKLPSGMSSEQYTELRNILRSKKRTCGFILEEPYGKKQCTFQASSFLTPPNTPNSNDGMDDMSKSEMGITSSLDLLQSLINIKNESKPVSLNTVQVRMDNMPLNDNTQEQLYPEASLTHSFLPTQSSQAFNHCSPPHNNEQYLLGPLETPNVAPQYNAEYNNFPDCSQIPNYPSVPFTSEQLQNCSMQSFVSFLVEPEAPSAMIHAEPAAQQNIPHQHYSPAGNTECSAFTDHNMVQASPNMSPQLCIQERNNSPFQMGKSFFQWQIEQEENKIASVSQEQLLSKDSDGDTYLHISVAQGRRALSYVLARKMAALNTLDIKEHNNQSALQVAVAANQHLIVQDLISLGAQVSTTDCWGRTPIHVCAQKGYYQVLQAIQKGATENNQYIDVDAKNYEGLTALHCAVIAHNAVVHQLQSKMQNRSPETEELLLKNKAMVDTVKTLLHMGASVGAMDCKSGRTALHLASEEANLELISLFLELPTCLTFINEKAFTGNTALHVAASLQYRRTQLGAVRLLMRKGADPSARNLENEQPVHLVPEGPVGEEIRRVLKGKATQHRTSSY